MKILIAGAGKVGFVIATQLSSEGHDITLIDSDLNILENEIEQCDVMSVCGNCATRDTLVKAGIKDADLLIATTGADEVNLLSCVIAHSINPALHTIARIRNPEYSDQIYKMRDIFALSMIVNPEKMAAIEIERLLKYPGFLKREAFAKGRAEIVELKIDAQSQLCNLPLKNLGSVIKCKVLVCVVLRDGEAIAPDGEFIIKDGDRLFVTAPTNNLSVLLNGLGVVTKKVKNVLICGGGRVGYYLAKKLSHDGFKVSIIEKDYQTCINLDELLPEVEIIHGDATNQPLLESEGLTDSDALVTLTGLDELNIIISLYGHSLAIPQVITKLSHMQNSEILNNLPLGSIISPDELCCSSIVRYVRAMKNQAGAALAVHFIADRHTEAIEFRVDEGTQYVGQPLKNIKLKKNVIIACISHQGIIEIPDGNSIFNNGDSMVVITPTGGEKLYQLNDIFE